jgi:Na+/phosphate symporter
MESALIYHEFSRRFFYMLNPLFAFGVPAALMVAYMIFYFLKRMKSNEYRRFALTLISVFLTTFSYQVYNYSQTVISLTSAESFQKNFGYSQGRLIVPFALGAILTVINVYYLFRQFRKKE